VPTKNFYCGAIALEGSECIRVDAYGNTFLLSLPDANKQYNYLRACLAKGRFPIPLTLISSCPSLVQHVGKALSLSEVDTNELVAALAKVVKL
jgi:hypothetical protein